MRTTVLGLGLAACLAGAARGQVLGEWRFEEGSFLGGYGPGSPSVVDLGPYQNDGYRPSTATRVRYTAAAHSGAFALEFNAADDARPYPGVVAVPHGQALEPATGRIELWIAIDQHHDAIVVTKATFQWKNREPGPHPPVFFIDGDPRIVGRTVYHLAIRADGRVEALIGNDDPLATPGNGGGPWTRAVSQDVLPLGQWVRIGMEWDGQVLRVLVGGAESGAAAYRPTRGDGLSYHATGDDPTYGPVELGLSLSSTGSPFVGRMDDVVITVARPCAEPEAQARGSAPAAR